MQDETQPRLCYFGSLPVEASSAGPAQLYRLLQTYPPDCLYIIEADCPPSTPSRRIPEVGYDRIMRAFERGWGVARMRIPRLFWTMLEANARWQARHAAKLVAAFRPEAILTIHDQFGWFTAAKLARILRVPLHIIMHDDWFRNIPMADTLKPRFEDAFGSVYRAAASRLCISPYMEEEYARRFQASGSVLYPIRDPKSARHLSPPASLASASHSLKVAYAGNVWHHGNWESLCDLASALEIMGGQLLIFGPTTAGDTVRNGLARQNVVVKGFADDLIQALRDEAHVVFVPMTFEPGERRNMQISFPSKIADYSATGLPIMIYGPEYCSAVRWARKNPDSAEVVTQEGQDGLRSALERLSDPKWRDTLARRALELGNQYFAFESGTKILHAAIRSGHGRPLA